MLPGYDTLVAKDAELLEAKGPTAACIVLHGILGRGSNWRSVARRIVRDVPEIAVVLMDLRAHGRSRDLTPPDSLDTAADDIEHLETSLDLPVTAVLGHSFGGKVAMRLASRVHSGVRQLIVVDSLPGAPADRRGAEHTIEVVDMLAELPKTFSGRGAFASHVVGKGFAQPIARWLAQNLDPVDGGFRFALDIDRIRTLLDDYFVTDLWPTLSPPRAGLNTTLIIGGRSTVFDDEARSHAKALADAHPNLRVHVLESADHWVHIDEPDRLHEIVVQALREAT